MLKQFFGNRRTTRIDVLVGIGGAVLAVIHAVGVTQQYKSEQPENDPNNTQENHR